jgi:hypothetical protein
MNAKLATLLERGAGGTAEKVGYAAGLLESSKICRKYHPWHA